MNVEKFFRSLGITFFSVAVVVTVTAVSEANIDQMKVYKSVFPGSKPKCIDCHVSKMPKKADGKDDLNAYGLKVKAIAEAPTEEAYKAAGSIEDFEVMDAEEIDDVVADEEVEQK